MKLKSLPEDFQVEEVPAVTPGKDGRFTFYRLTKRGLGTLEAIDAICRRWDISSRRVSYGGLKDRHAVTIQYLTILEGPSQPLKQTSLELEPLGRVNVPYGPQHFRGNRFGVVIRHLNSADLDRAVRASRELATDGLPNYFDDQRFGSVGFGGEFIAQAWLAGNYERALWLALVEPNAADRPDTKAEKQVLRECWKNWPEAKARLGRSHARSLVTYLVDHPEDFRGGFARVRRELRSLYFSAFQSHLWNLILAGWLERATRPEQRALVEFKLATLPVQRGLDPDQADALRRLSIPLPSSRTALPAGPLGDVAREVMERFKLAWEAMRVKHLKDVFFSKGSRPALFFAERLEHTVSGDELAPGRKALRLSFELPKGAYATLVVKRITDATT
jgi:tRNA pseudouridine13 synthase